MTASVNGLPTLAREVSPLLVAHLTDRSADKLWGVPAWAVNHDLPFYSRSTKGGRWQTCYQGRHYGLASESTEGARVPVLGHWEREPSNGETLKQGTLLFDFGVNGHTWRNDHDGGKNKYGKVSTLQHRNKLLVAANAWDTGVLRQKVEADGGLRTLSGAVGLYSHHPDAAEPPPYDIPISTPVGEPVFIRSGVTHIAVRAIAGTRCVVSRGVRETWKGITYPAPLLVTCYLLEQEQAPVTDWAALERLGCVAFAVELSDETEETWEAFRARAGAAGAECFVGQGGTNLEYGELSATYPYTGQDRRLLVPQVRGLNPYPTHLLRDTTDAQMARAAAVSKHGHTLTQTPGRCAYLLVRNGGVLAMTPDPEPSAFRLDLPGGGVIEAAQPVTCARVEAYNSVVTIEHVGPPVQWRLAGLPAGTRATVNGRGISV